MDEERENVEVTEKKENEKEEIGFLNAVLKFFIEPTGIFPVLVEKKIWFFFPICLLSLSTFFSTYVFFERIDRESFMREQFRHSKFSSQMSQEQIDKAVNDFKEKSSFLQSITVPIFILVWLLLASLVYYLCFLALGGEISFIKTLYVVYWAELTTCIAQIISIPIMLVKAPDELLNPQEILLTNLGAIIGNENLSPVMFSLLSAIDVFAIWNLILITLGLAAISKLSQNFSAIIVFSLYGAKVVLKTVWIAFFLQ